MRKSQEMWPQPHPSVGGGVDTTFQHLTSPVQCFFFEVMRSPLWLVVFSPNGFSHTELYYWLCSSCISRGMPLLCTPHLYLFHIPSKTEADVAAARMVQNKEMSLVKNSLKLMTPVFSLLLVGELNHVKLNVYRLQFFSKVSEVLFIPTIFTVVI